MRRSTLRGHVRIHWPPATAARKALALTGVLGLAVAGALTAGASGAQAASASSAASAGTAASSASAGSGAMTADQALSRARRSGKKVAIPGATTADSTLTANPDGTLTRTETVQPVRKWVSGSWKALDPTLRVNADGSVYPAVTTGELSLSGGGSGPLATMTEAGRKLAVSLPVKLPQPTVYGPVATYRDVLAGVDLQVTVTAQGGFSETLVVHDAKAAADPSLESLAMPVTTNDGITLSSDSAGNIAATDRAGRSVFHAPAPVMWDSTPSSATTVTDPATGQKVDSKSGDPVRSSAQSPGESARIASLGARASGGRVTLTPSQSLLASKKTTYPVYIDPTWTPDAAGSKRNSWTDVNNAFPTTSYWKTSSLLQVGYNGWDTPYFTARSFFNVSVPSDIYGATVQSSTMTIAEEWSPSCTAKGVELWKTGTINSGTDWNNQPSWISAIDSVSAAHGYSSTCPAANIGFDTTGIMKDAASGKWTNLTIGLRASDETSRDGWKKFSDSLASFSTTYDHAPSTPTTLTTSPATSCTGTVGTVGDGNVSLYAKVSDPDDDPVGASFAVTKAATGASIVTSSNTTALSSGSTAQYTLPEATLKTAAAGTITKINWKVQVTDYKYASSWSTTCSFSFDPTRPGGPSFGTDPGGEKIGSTASFTILPPATGTAPSSYSYQLNGAAPVAVNAAASGAPTTIAVTPTRFTNTLSASSVSAGGNVSSTLPAVLIFNAVAATPAADGDFTGDRIPDLLNVGARNGYPSGLWVNPGQAGTGHTAGDGQIVPSASDLGTYGNGFTAPGKPADYDGADVISGRFTPSGMQDVLAYYPSTGNASILSGNGDGSPLASSDAGSQESLVGLLSDNYGHNPQNLVNMGNTSGHGVTYPDLLGVAYDATAGYYLDYYPAVQSPQAEGTFDFPTAELTPSPDGTRDWSLWSISTAQMSSGTAMFLWNSSSHLLYLWLNPTFDGNGTFSPGTQYLISNSTTTFNPAAGAQLQAADINGDGTPDLWATTSGPSTTAYLVTKLSATGTATVTAQSPQTLLTGNHTYTLGDIGSSPVDSTGTLNLTTTGSGVTADSGDLFSPDASFDGSANAYLTTSSPALTPGADFSISAWVKPTAWGGTVLAQEGTKANGVTLYSDVATGKWIVAMAQADTTGATRDVDTATGNTGVAALGQWTHLSVTYKASTGSLALYVDGIISHRIAHTAATFNSAPFHIGNNFVAAGGQAGNFSGQIAAVQVWNQTLTPTEMAQQSGTPGYVMFESDDTNYTSGSTWSTAHGKLTFSNGYLAVTETGSGSATVKFGATGTSASVFTVQSDGNLVIYPQAAHTDGTALWGAKTNKHPNDVLFMQPDGNLVLYDSDATVLWSSATNN
jgi:hypothetical protein